MKEKNELIKKILHILNIFYSDTKILSQYVKQESEDLKNKTAWRIAKFWGVFFVGVATIYSAWHIASIEKKFKPLILEKQQSEAYTLLFSTNSNKMTLTTNPFELPIPLKKENSGDIKKLVLSYFIEDDITIRDITTENFLTIDLTGNIQDEFLELQLPEKTDASSKKFVGLFLNDIENVKTNLLHLRYVGYANDTVNVTGILFFDEEKLKIHLLYGEEVSDNAKLKDIYTKLKFEGDPFWKKRNINNLVEFKKYIINQRKLFIKELNELGE